MKNNYTIRLATVHDAEGMLQIYAHYVKHTSFTFEYEVPSVEEFKQRVAAILPKYPWLVCEDNGVIVAYAYAHEHRYRTAYQWSAESTIYMAESYHGFGIAAKLYSIVFEILKLQGFANVYAGVLQSNVRSKAFHEKMGFSMIGTFRNIGYKLSEWHSNDWYELHLAEHQLEPAKPLTMQEVSDREDFKLIIASMNAPHQSISQ